MDSSDKEFDDGYDDDLMGNAEDRATLAAMTEKERETELFKRVERREMLKTRFNIENKLNQAKRERKAEILRKREERQKEKIRLEKKVNGPKRASVKNCKKERGEKSQTSDKGTCGYRMAKKKLKASDIYSDESSSDDENTVQWFTQHSGIVKQVTTSATSDEKNDLSNRYIKTREELEKIILSRHKLKMFLDLPIFDDIVIGCFVRVVVDRKDNENLYSIAEIIDVGVTDNYDLEGKQTNKLLYLKHGRRQFLLKGTFVSNEKISDKEFKYWKYQCLSGGVVLPIINDVTIKFNIIKAALVIGLPKQDIEKILMEKENSELSGPVTNKEVKKSDLFKLQLMLNDEIESANDMDQQRNKLDKKMDAIVKWKASVEADITYVLENHRTRSEEQSDQDLSEVSS